jgi:hypothetical protein
MRTLLVAAAFVAVTAYPATACDWNREASTQDQVVATATDQIPQGTAQAAPACSGSDCTAPQATSVATEETSRKPVFETAPIVLVTDRH